MNISIIIPSYNNFFSSKIEAITTGIFDTSGSALSVLRTDQPSISGIKISKVIKLGLIFLANSIPYLPLFAITTL